MEKEMFRNDFWKLVGESKNILITSHKNPDDDSISSVLSTFYLIKERFPEKNLRIMYTGGSPDKWKYFENFDKVESVEDITDHLDLFDLVIVLDVTQYDRFVNNVEKFKSFSGKKICIDHHPTDNDDFYDLRYFEKLSSVAEIIYKIFLEEKPTIEKRLGELIVIGILGDTGWLTWAFEPNDPAVFLIVGRLVQDGDINLEELKPKFYSYTENVFYIIQELVKNAEFIQINSWPKMLCSRLTREFINENNFDELDVKQASNIFIASYGKSIEEISWGISAYPLENGGVSISLRSRSESVNVRLVAENIGLGGGHDGSSSIKFKSDNAEALATEECVEIFLNWLKSHDPIMR